MEVETTNEKVTVEGLIKTAEAFYSARQGWICPRCNKSWSPDVDHCDCASSPIINTDHARLVISPAIAAGVAALKWSSRYAKYGARPSTIFKMVQQKKI